MDRPDISKSDFIHNKCFNILVCYMLFWLNCQEEFFSLNVQGIANNTNGVSLKLNYFMINFF